MQGLGLRVKNLGIKGLRRHLAVFRVLLDVRYHLGLVFFLCVCVCVCWTLQ